VRKTMETRGMELTHWEVVDTPKHQGESSGSEQRVAGEKSLPNQATTAEGSTDGRLPRGVLRRNGTQASRQNPDVTPKLLAGRRAPSASSILRRGMISGCCHAKVNIGSTKPVSTRGYWSSRVHARCAARVSNARTAVVRINLPYTDFYALENMISGRSEDQHGIQENDHEHEHPPSPHPAEDVSRDTSGSPPEGGEVVSANTRGITTKPTHQHLPRRTKTNETNIRSHLPVHNYLVFEFAVDPYFTLYFIGSWRYAPWSKSHSLLSPLSCSRLLRNCLFASHIDHS
jgi:hypothetical protein